MASLAVEVMVRHKLAAAQASVMVNTNVQTLYFRATVHKRNCCEIAKLQKLHFAAVFLPKPLFIQPLQPGTQSRERERECVCGTAYTNGKTGIANKRWRLAFR